MKDEIPDLADPAQMIMERVVPKNEDTLSTITRLGRKLMELQNQAVQQIAELTRTELQMKEIQEKLLPDLLNSVGLTELTLAGGHQIGIKTEYFAKIPKGTADAAFLWLRQHNMAGVIKEELDIQPGFKSALEQAHIPFNVKQDIHSSTLKAFVKEQVEQGGDFPRELFGVHVATRAVIKPA